MKGFAPTPDLPSFGRLYTYFHYLGDARRFQPFHSIESESTLRPDDAPCMNDFRVAGSPALPVSVLLEYALAVGDWVQPEPPAQLRWRELRNLRVDLPALAGSGALTFVKRAAGGRRDAVWVVGVELAVGEAELAHMELVYSRDEPAAGPEVSIDADGEAEEVAPVPPLAWHGRVYRAAQWRQARDGTIVGQVRTAEPSDLWATTFVPEAALPGAQLENIFRAELSLQRPAAAVRRLCLRRMERFSGSRGWGPVVRSAEGSWSVLDKDGRTALHLEGLVYEA